MKSLRRKIAESLSRTNMTGGYAPNIFDFDDEDDPDYKKYRQD